VVLPKRGVAPKGTLFRDWSSTSCPIDHFPPVQSERILRRVSGPFGLCLTNIADCRPYSDNAGAIGSNPWQRRPGSARPSQTHSICPTVATCPVFGTLVSGRLSGLVLRFPYADSYVDAATGRRGDRGPIIGAEHHRVMAYPRGRVCDYEGCSTRLSVYNHGSLCSAHDRLGAALCVHIARRGSRRTGRSSHRRAA